MLFKFLENIEDDRTVICCYNSETPLHISRESRYFMEPDWRYVLKKHLELLYPNLNVKEPKETDSNAKSLIPLINEHKYEKRRYSIFERICKRLKRNV